MTDICKEVDFSQIQPGSCSEDWNADISQLLNAPQQEVCDPSSPGIVQISEKLKTLLDRGYEMPFTAIMGAFYAKNRELYDSMKYLLKDKESGPICYEPFDLVERGKIEADFGTRSDTFENDAGMISSLLLSTELLSFNDWRTKTLMQLTIPSTLKILQEPRWMIFEGIVCNDKVSAPLLIELATIDQGKKKEAQPKSSLTSTSAFSYFLQPLMENVCRQVPDDASDVDEIKKTEEKTYDCLNDPYLSINQFLENLTKILKLYEKEFGAICRPQVLKEMGQYSPEELNQAWKTWAFYHPDEKAENAGQFQSTVNQLKAIITTIKGKGDYGGDHANEVQNFINLCKFWDTGEDSIKGYLESIKSGHSIPLIDQYGIRKP
jgi:hypothetical protein